MAIETSSPLGGAPAPASDEMALARALAAQFAAKRAEDAARKQETDLGAQRVERRHQGAAAILLDIWA